MTGAQWVGVAAFVASVAIVGWEVRRGLRRRKVAAFKNWVNESPTTKTIRRQEEMGDG